VIAVLPGLVHDVGMRVLVVEDHVELADDIADGLRDRGIATDIAYDGAAALDKGLVNRYDVIVLDRDVPKVHGDAVCVALGNAKSEARILMLTAAAGIGDRVHGLNLGADDYLPKPFAFEELVARIHALARRAPATAPLLVRGELVLDRARRRAIRAGRELPLARKELGVLEVLLAADGGVVSAEELLVRVWDENADPFTRTVTVTLGRLRRKLGEPDVIETVVGAGYRMR
jgi:DNA-binding response OmpR family regulator